MLHHIKLKGITLLSDVILYPDVNVNHPRRENWLGTEVNRDFINTTSELGSNAPFQTIQPNWTLVLNVDKNSATIRREGTNLTDEPIRVSLMQSGESNTGPMSTTSGVVSSSDHASRIEIKSNKRRDSVSTSSSKSTEISTERTHSSRTKPNIVRIRMKDRGSRYMQGDPGIDGFVGRSQRHRYPPFLRDREGDDYWELPKQAYRTQPITNDDYVPSGQYTGSLIVGDHRRSRGRSRTRRSEENRVRSVSMDRTRYDRAAFDNTMEDSVFYSMNRPQFSSERSLYEGQESVFGMKLVDDNRWRASTGDIRLVPVKRGESYFQRSPRLVRKSPQRSEQLLKQGKLVEDYDVYGGYTKFSWDDMQNRIHDGTMPIGLSGAGLQWSSSQTRDLRRSPDIHKQESRTIQSGDSGPNYKNKMKQIISPRGTLFVSTDGKDVIENLQSPVKDEPNTAYYPGGTLSDFGGHTSNNYPKTEISQKTSYFANGSNYQDIKSSKTVPIVKDQDGSIEYQGTLTISDKLGRIPRQKVSVS